MIQLAIFTECDRPCVALVVAFNDATGKIAYLNDDIGPRRKNGDWEEAPCEPGSITPLSEFGVELALWNGRLSAIRVRPSIAKYKDGAPRDWQGYAGEQATLRADIPAITERRDLLFRNADR